MPEEYDREKKRIERDSSQNDESTDDIADTTIGPDIYEAERIVKHGYRNGKIHFYVKWKGYSSAHNTWEPEENIFCKQLIDIYAAKLEQKGKTLNWNRCETKALRRSKRYNEHANANTKRNTKQRVLHKRSQKVTNYMMNDDSSLSTTESRPDTNSFIVDSDESSTPSTTSSSQASNETPTTKTNTVRTAENINRIASPAISTEITVKRRGPGRPTNAQRRRQSILNCYGEKMIPFITVTDVTVNGSICTFVECKKREGFFAKK